MSPRQPRVERDKVQTLRRWSETTGARGFQHTIDVKRAWMQMRTCGMACVQAYRTLGRPGVTPGVWPA